MQKPPGIACLDGLSMSTALRTGSRALSDDVGLHVNLLARLAARNELWSDSRRGYFPTVKSTLAIVRSHAM